MTESRACLWLALCVGLSPVRGANPAGGDAVCDTCHTAQTAHFRASPMAQALETVPRCEILKQHPDLSFQDGAYRLAGT